MRLEWYFYACFLQKLDHKDSKMQSKCANSIVIGQRMISFVELEGFSEVSFLGADFGEMAISVFKLFRLDQLRITRWQFAGNVIEVSLWIFFFFKVLGISLSLYWPSP